MTGRTTFLIDRSPGRDVDRTLRQLERGLAAECVREALTQFGECARRALCTDRDNDGIQQLSGGAASLPRQSLRRATCVRQKVDRLLVLLRRDEASAIVDALRVFLESDSNDVRDALDGMLLRRRTRGGAGERGNDGEKANPLDQHGSASHCR